MIIQNQNRPFQTWGSHSKFFALHIVLVQIMLSAHPLPNILTSLIPQKVFPFPDIRPEGIQDYKIGKFRYLVHLNRKICYKECNPSGCLLPAYAGY
jgi:hypothetical protein